jgi:polysaccharide transporter, PST family
MDSKSPAVAGMSGSAIRAGAARGALVTGLAQAYKVCLNFVASVVLARLLAPTDFGLVAMVTSFVAFVTLIQDLGMNQATVQRERISLAQISALFWLSIGVSFLLAAALAAGAPAIAWFYGDERLIPLTIAFAFVVLLGGSQSQLLALLTRGLKFKALSAVDALSGTVGVLVGIGCAFATRSYWALFLAGAAQVATSLVCLWFVSSFRPVAPSFEGELREIVKFGSGISGFNIVNYFSRNTDYLLIGHIYGSVQLGLYDRAYRLMLFPLSQIQAPLSRVMLPFLAQLRYDPGRYRQAYIECVSLLMMACQPGILFVSIFAEDVFSILFGPRWESAASIFRWLGFTGLLQVWASTLGWLFISQGRGGGFFKIGLINASVIVGSFLIGVSRGPIGVAIAYTLANYLVLLPIGLFAAGRRGPVASRDLIAAAGPHGLASLASATLLGCIYMKSGATNVFACVGLTILSYAMYGAVMLAFPAKRLLLKKNVLALTQMYGGR